MTEEQRAKIIASAEAEYGLSVSAGAMRYRVGTSAPGKAKPKTAAAPKAALPKKHRSKNGSVTHKSAG